MLWHTLHFFVVPLRSLFYVNNQFIWCNAFLPQIEAAFIGNIVQCGFHFSRRKAAHRVFSEKAAEPGVVLPFPYSPAVLRNNSSGGTSGSCIPQHLAGRLASIDIKSDKILK